MLATLLRMCMLNARLRLSHLEEGGRRAQLAVCQGAR